MQKFLLLSTLCACGFVCAPVRAQDAAPLDVAAKSGADVFVEARALMKDGPNGEPSAREKLAPDENLRRQRLAVARNAPALAKLREALKLYIVFPAFDSEQATPGLSHMDAFAAAREFARQLYQEAAVRAADGDAMGAAQSSLDALELATQAARGPIMHALSGSAVAAVARKSLLLNAKTLDAAQLKTVADKWEKISGHFPTYAHALRDEEQLQMRLTYRNTAHMIAQWSDPTLLAQAEAEMKKERENGELSKLEFEISQMSLLQVKGLTFADINAESRQIFEGALLRAAKPYFAAKKEAPLPSTNPLTGFTAEFVSAASTRFFAERDKANNSQLIAALQLRAAKLENGQYPATFETPPDPFSPDLAPMIYKRAGDSYVLYSVGPDGKDNGGAEIQTLITDDKTGAKKVSDRLAPDSTGDIVAPVL